MTDSEHFREADCELTVGDGVARGGQHTGVTSSRVRALHVPTGLWVECIDHRSQYKNKLAAMVELRALVESAYERHPDDNG